MKHLGMDVWPYFPGLKVGKISIQYFLFDFLMALIMNHKIVRSVIISELGGGLELFSLAVFVYPVRVHFEISHLSND
jgi:hypothetical protein